MKWLARIAGKVACNLGSHRGRHITGSYPHRYYVCRRCKLRYVRSSKDGAASHILVNGVWLKGGPFKSSLGKKQKGVMRNAGQKK